jgi:hypothetical protein
MVLQVNPASGLVDDGSQLAADVDETGWCVRAADVHIGLGWLDGSSLQARPLSSADSGPAELRWVVGGGGVRGGAHSAAHRARWWLDGHGPVDHLDTGQP